MLYLDLEFVRQLLNASHKLESYELGGSQIPKILVWISSKAYPIPLPYLRSHVKFQVSNCMGSARSSLVHFTKEI